MDMSTMSNNSTSSPSTTLNDPQPPTPPSVPLPPSVEKMLQTICAQQNQPLPNLKTRRELAWFGEQHALEILTKIASSKIRSTLDGFIVYMVKKEGSRTTNGYDSPSPIKTPRISSPENSPVTPRMNLKFHG